MSTRKRISNYIIVIIIFRKHKDLNLQPPFQTMYLLYSRETQVRLLSTLSPITD